MQIFIVRWVRRWTWRTSPGPAGGRIPPSTPAWNDPAAVQGLRNLLAGGCDASLGGLGSLSAWRKLPLPLEEDSLER